MFTLPCDLDCSVSVNSTLSVICLSLAFTSSVMTLFSSRSVKLEEIRTDPMESHWKTQFMSRYYVVMLVQC